MALRVSVLLFLLIPSVFCRPAGIRPVVDDASIMGSRTVLPRNLASTGAHPAPSPASVLASTDKSETGHEGAAERDGSSGAIISAASIGSVALVVVACGGCFILGKRRKRPGFHMPTILVDIDTAREQPDDSPSSSPTSVRPPWRDSVRKSMPAHEPEGESSHEQHPLDGASNSRPPSYASAKDPLYPPGPSSRAP